MRENINIYVICTGYQTILTMNRVKEKKKIPVCSLKSCFMMKHTLNPSSDLLKK